MELTPFHGPPASVPRIPGVEARTLLGFGAHGEVWLADDLTTGRAVAVKIGRSRPGEESADEAVARETALLSRIRHPHVVRLHRVVHLPGGSLALVLDLADGGSLASLVAARGPLDPGEATTLLIPLTDALRHLHDRGLVHGDISPGNVLLTADGRPQLGDLGVGRLLGARAENVWSTPGFTDPVAGSDPRSADLWGLAAIGWFALTGQPPPPGNHQGDGELQAVLRQCLAADPGARPTLAEFAAGAWRAARPVPVRLVTEVASLGLDAGLPPLSARVTRRAFSPPPETVVPVAGPPPRRHRWRLVAALGCAALVLGGGTAALVPRLTGAPVVATPAPASLEEQARVALDRIGEARATAFSTLSVTALAAADEPGSPAERSDRALVGRLRSAGYRLEGVRYQVTQLRVLSRQASAVRVRASVTTSSHRRVGTGGSGVVVSADGPREVEFTLVPGAVWRVSSVGPGA